MAEIKTGIEGDFYLFNGTFSWSGTTTVTGSRVGFCTGVSYSWDQSGMAVFDRGTASHWKKGRGKGELSVPCIYVDNENIVAYLSGSIAGSSVPRNQAEIRCYGTAGALERSIQFQDVRLAKYDRKEGEGDAETAFTMNFDLMKEPGTSSGTKIG